MGLSSPWWRCSTPGPGWRPRGRDPCALGFAGAESCTGRTGTALQLGMKKACLPARLLAQGLEQGAESQRAGQALGARVRSGRFRRTPCFRRATGGRRNRASGRPRRRARAEGVHGRQPDGAVAHVGGLGRTAGGGRAAGAGGGARRRRPPASHVVRVGAVLVSSSISIGRLPMISSA